jgi:hypothetical protein
LTGPTPAPENPGDPAAITNQAADKAEFTENTAPEPTGNPPPVVPESLDEKTRGRERARAWIAKSLCYLLAATLLIIVIRSCWLLKTIKDATDLLGVILSPLIGLVGAATGFYYGGKD